MESFLSKDVMCTRPHDTCLGSLEERGLHSTNTHTAHDALSQVLGGTNADATVVYNVTHLSPMRPADLPLAAFLFASCDTHMKHS